MGPILSDGANQIQYNVFVDTLHSGHHQRRGLHNACASHRSSRLIPLPPHLHPLITVGQVIGGRLSQLGFRDSFGNYSRDTRLA